jgi:hypothetical protein
MGVENVYLGVCNVSCGGDLGLIKGGVSVSIQTDIRDVIIDSLGTKPQVSAVLGRKATITVNMAENSGLNTKLLGDKAIGYDLMLGTTTLTITSNVGGPTLTFTDVVPSGVGSFNLSPENEIVYSIQFTAYGLSL